MKKIVSIGSLAQAVLACALGDPANARARPSSLIKSDDDYNKIFNVSYPLEVYYNSAELTLRVENILRSTEYGISSAHLNNTKFYVAMIVAMRLMGSISPSARKMSSVTLDDATEKLLLEGVKLAWCEYEKLGGTDQVAKGSQLKESIIGKLKELI